MLKEHSDRVNSAVFSSDGTHIVSASYDYTARIWDTATEECEAVLKGHSHGVFSSGTHMVSTPYDTAKIWNTARGECEAELQKHTSVLSFSQNSQLPITSLPSGVFLTNAPQGMLHVHLSLTHIMISYFTPQTFKKSAFHLLTASQFPLLTISLKYILDMQLERY